MPVCTQGATVVDLDGDGRLEVVGRGPTTFSPLRVTVFSDTGGNLIFRDVTTTWFPAHARIDRTLDFHYRCHHVADLDGDGDPDVLTGGSEGRSMNSTTVGVPPRLLINTGTSLVDGTRERFPFTQESSLALAAGDVDGDGDIDLLTAESQITLWRQSREGNFFSRLIGTAGRNISELELFDVDRDGDLDLFAALGWHPSWGGIAGQPRLYLNDGSGLFTDATATHVPAGRQTAASIATGDIDGDGDDDVVLGTTDEVSGSPDLLLLNDGSGRFTDASAQLPANNISECETVELVDVDGDSDLDIVIGTGRYSSSSTRGVSLYLNDGTGQFTDATAARVPFVNRGERMTISDVDSDGDPDIVIVGRQLRNDGNGNFSSFSSQALPHLMADLDEDGSMDIVEMAPSQVRIGPSRHDYGYSTVAVLALPVDIDRDGDLDLFCGGMADSFYNEWTIAWPGVLLNRHRDVRSDNLAQAGKTWRLRFRSGTPSTVFPAMSTALGQRVTVPGLGDYQLDPLQAFTLAPLSAAPNAVLSIAIPATTSLVGSNIYVQSLFIPTGDPTGAHLSNLVVETIWQ